MAGPLEQKLDSFGDLCGMVIGQMCEGSQGIHTLLQRLATEKAEKIRRSTGRPVDDHERGLILQQIRRRLSVAAVISQSSC